MYDDIVRIMIDTITGKTQCYDFKWTYNSRNIPL